MRNKTTSGFTLIEVLVVIAIIGVLAAVVLVALDNTRAKARDAQRKSDLRQVQSALELYYEDHESYRVEGGGYRSRGHGWLSYNGGGGSRYPVSVIEQLQAEGYFGAADLEDPVQDPGYMIYTCNGGQRYSLTATLENPTDEDIANIQTVCNSGGANSVYTRYGKNYAVTEPTGK